MIRHGRRQCYKARITDTVRGDVRVLFTSIRVLPCCKCGPVTILPACSPPDQLVQLVHLFPDIPRLLLNDSQRSTGCDEISVLEILDDCLMCQIIRNSQPECESIASGQGYTHLYPSSESLTAVDMFIAFQVETPGRLRSFDLCQGYRPDRRIDWVGSGIRGGRSRFLGWIGLRFDRPG